MDVRRKVCKGEERKYYRFRFARFYGGVATADCTGCNLKCFFCWSWRPRDLLIGRFYSPMDVFEKLVGIAEKNGVNKVRISGNEPTLCEKHLLRVLELFQETDLLFILETNGTLLDERYVRKLSRFDNLHVRVSLKGTNEEEFRALTGTSGFQKQLDALKNLLDHGVSFHPAVMVSFSSKQNFERLLEELKEMDPHLVKSLEVEEVVPYPHVREKIREHLRKLRS
ncbi:MAG TPA: radical SAM protein [Candidatus Aenigmarchaeota archaeon]|nr:radical SAM protein [Candidatus Aenigmarchaeota archaeon]